MAMIRRGIVAAAAPAGGFMACRNGRASDTPAARRKVRRDSTEFERLIIVRPIYLVWNTVLATTSSTRSRTP